MNGSRAIKIKEKVVEGLIEKYLLPKLDKDYDSVVGVLNAGKPISEIVADKLGVNCEYVKCSGAGVPYIERCVEISGRKNYGENPLFLDDVCDSGATLAALKTYYKKGSFASLIAKENIFYPVSAITPWLRYVTPKDVIIGIVSKDPIIFEWEGKKFDLPVNEVSVTIKLKEPKFEYFTLEDYYKINNEKGVFI